VQKASENNIPFEVNNAPHPKRVQISGKHKIKAHSDLISLLALLIILFKKRGSL
jgi:hypothetical protein